MKNLDLWAMKGGFISIKIGTLSKEVIAILNLNREESDIIMWEDRFKYIEKHKKDFKSDADFEKHIAAIPTVIEDPDYVGVHPTKNSIEYIKIIDEILIVVVRIKKEGNLAFRTSYPLTQNQLQGYIKSGTVKPLKKSLDDSE